MPKHCQAKAPQERLKQSTVTAPLEKKERKKRKQENGSLCWPFSESLLCVCVCLRLFVSLPFVCRRQTSFFKGRAWKIEGTDFVVMVAWGWGGGGGGIKPKTERFTVSAACCSLLILTLTAQLRLGVTHSGGVEV